MERILLSVTDLVRDPLDLGQRLVSVLETGRRTATYKLATLMALIDFSIENAPQDPGDELRVPVRDLAVRVLDLYWRQVRPRRERPSAYSRHSRWLGS